MRALAAVLLLLALVTSTAWGKPGPHPTPESHRATVSFRYIEGQRAEVKLGDRGNHVVWRVEAAALAKRAAWHDVGPPPQQWRGRNDLVSTDDVAWVALAYMKLAEVGKGNVSKARDEARKALRTLLALQRADGSFVAYQVAEAPGEGVTLYSANDWMASARAIQAMGAGIRTFANDGGLVDSLQKALELSLQRIQATWTRLEHNVGRHYIIDQMRLPAWLPYNRADAAAAVVLGLCDWYGTRRTDTPLTVLRALADALAETQKGASGAYPWYAFLPQVDKPALWYADGNLQAAALIRAREALQKPTYLTTAMLEGDVLYPRLLATYPFIWQFSPGPEVAPRVPGTAASLAINASALYRFTGKDRFAVTAALFASWLLDTHEKEPPLYDPSSGRCAEVGDAGARSASPGASARALYALLEVGQTPGVAFLESLPDGHDAAPIVLQAVDGRPVSEPIGVQEVNPPGGPRRLARVIHDNAFWLKFDVATPTNYKIDMVYMKDRTSGAVVNVRLDGDAILSIPLGSTDGDPLLSRQPAVGPTRLDPGLHTLGVRGNGLMLSSGTLLDVFVVQPVVAWRSWHAPDGHHVAVVSSYSEKAEVTDFPASLALPAKLRRASLWSSGADPASASRASLEAERLTDGAWRVRVPDFGSGLLEW